MKGLIILQLFIKCLLKIAKQEEQGAVTARAITRLIPIVFNKKNSQSVLYGVN